MRKAIALLAVLLAFAACDGRRPDKPAALINGRWHDITIAFDSWALICAIDGRSLGKIETFEGKEWVAETSLNCPESNIACDLNAWYDTPQAAQLAIEKKVVEVGDCKEVGKR